MNQQSLPGVVASPHAREDVLIAIRSEGEPDTKWLVRDALIFGPFAIHRSVAETSSMRLLGCFRDGDTITHRATGFAIGVDITEERKALELASYMEQLPLDWTSGDYKAIRESAGPLLRTEIRAHIAMSGGRA